MGRTKLLYNVTDVGREICVKSFGSTGETASDPEGKFKTCRVKESGRSWRNHRGEVPWDLQDEEEFP